MSEDAIRCWLSTVDEAILAQQVSQDASERSRDCLYCFLKKEIPPAANLSPTDKTQGTTTSSTHSSRSEVTSTLQPTMTTRANPTLQPTPIDLESQTQSPGESTIVQQEEMQGGPNKNNSTSKKKTRPDHQHCSLIKYSDITLIHQEYAEPTTYPPTQPISVSNQDPKCR